MKTIKKVEMYGIEIPISTYRTQGAITFKVLSLKHTEISASRYFLCYKKEQALLPAQTLLHIRLFSIRDIHRPACLGTANDRFFMNITNTLLFIT